MIKETYAIGDNVQKFCPACDEQFGHIVKSLTKTGLVSRVKCSRCGLTGAYKPSAKAAKIQELAGKTGDPYATTRTYRAGQIIAHPTFGTGEVMTVFNTRTIDVLFADRVRRLVHSRI